MGLKILHRLLQTQRIFLDFGNYDADHGPDYDADYHPDDDPVKLVNI